MRKDCAFFSFFCSFKDKTYLVINNKENRNKSSRSQFYLKFCFLCIPKNIVYFNALYNIWFFNSCFYIYYIYKKRTLIVKSINHLVYNKIKIILDTTNLTCAILRCQNNWHLNFNLQLRCCKYTNLINLSVNVYIYYLYIIYDDCFCIFFLS